MNVFEIYLKTTLPAERLAEAVSKILNVDFAKRFGVNRGGEYFEGKSGAVTLEILGNCGEVFIPERSEWPYYALVYCDMVTPEELNQYVQKAANAIGQSGIDAEIDQLS